MPIPVFLAAAVTVVNLAVLPSVGRAERAASQYWSAAEVAAGTGMNAIGGDVRRGAAFVLRAADEAASAARSAGSQVADAAVQPEAGAEPSATLKPSPSEEAKSAEGQVKNPPPSALKEASSSLSDGKAGGGLPDGTIPPVTGMVTGWTGAAVSASAGVEAIIPSRLQQTPDQELYFRDMIEAQFLDGMDAYNSQRRVAGPAR